MWKWLTALKQHWPQRKQAHARELLSTADKAIAILGGAGSVGLMLHAGRRNDSLALLAMFAIWVISPFVGVLGKVSKRWTGPARIALLGLTLCLTAGSLAIYGNVAAAP